MASFSVAAMFGRWHIQFVASNDLDEELDETADELDETGSAPLGAVSVTLAADDRPYFGFTPSHPDQAPWWDEEEGRGRLEKSGMPIPPTGRNNPAPHGWR